MNQKIENSLDHVLPLMPIKKGGNKSTISNQFRKQAQSPTILLKVMASNITTHRYTVRSDSILSFKSVVLYLAVKGLFHPSRDIQQYLETSLVIITWGST